jgi:hypothetical protein
VFGVSRHPAQHVDHSCVVHSCCKCDSHASCMHPVDVAVYKKEEPRSCRALMAPMHGPARAAAKQSFPADQPCDHAVPFPACCCSFQDAPPQGTAMRVVLRSPPRPGAVLGAPPHQAQGPPSPCCPHTRAPRRTCSRQHLQLCSARKGSASGRRRATQGPSTCTTTCARSNLQATMSTGGLVLQVVAGVVSRLASLPVS